MPGGRRPGAGRKPKPLSQHLADGTWRVHRHGPRPIAGATVLQMPAAAVEEWTPDPAEVAALSPRAQRWLSATLELYGVDHVEGLQLMEALRCLSRLEAIETAVAARGLVSLAAEGHPLVKSLEREQRLFSSLWAIARPRAK